MTKQEIFDTVTTHLFTQGKRADVGKGSYTSCRYRTGEGLKCAVGCLIKDEFYSETYEGSGVYDADVVDAVSKSIGIQPGETEDVFSLLGCLQNIHDDAFNSDSDGFNRRRLFGSLERMANLHKLNTDTLNKFKPENES